MEITELKTTPIDDKYWEVMEDYYYKTSRGIIRVPKGFRTDYASVPRIFRNIINSYGKHGRAAVVHDWLYSSQCKIDVTREEADKIFLEIMKECGVGSIKRNLMYRMVRIFGASHFRKGE
ncbi:MULTISPECIES: DUF1353 domain-containing protein [Fusobacterium]|uniref:DUF1353 domain-containing protein n=1 Tax=Fusobacterium TaxID=848 RepID=UPI00044515E8|nr:MULTISPECIES: DUF1353 domain-containing protein [Fusobacterium]EUB33198.1 PF07087 family protein [Fusobacterium sp. OBRC1]WRL72607.1 DUF1353 domain-containing protein [Fusobacterium polymorphum]DAI15769.1 MAG TPA: Protein of unknown function (DUF1353) [Caudoviricetes sp.]